MSEHLTFKGQFTFVGWSFDHQSGQLECTYRDSKYGTFIETFVFPEVELLWTQKHEHAINSAIDCLYWMAGVSYYKTSLANNITFESKKPNHEQAKWLCETWQAGLAELAYENNLGWLEHISIKGGNYASDIKAMALRPRSLVAIGGGKDSLVSIESIKQMGEDADLFMVGQNEFIQSVATKTGLKIRSIARKVDSKLKSVNDAGAYNGHIPITAINKCVAVVAALLYDYDSIVFSNERSADAGNVEAENGQWINHQYSKSLTYEKSWQNIIKTQITDQLHCFSLMRPFSELSVIQKFAELKQYFPHFSSCNRNFHLSGSQNLDKQWCGQCPKCAFVFLCLAPFISKKELLNIFKKNLLDDESLDSLFDSLLGIEGLKPFECVGEQVECRLAVKMLAKHNEWCSHQKIKQWMAVLPEILVDDENEVLNPCLNHMIPPKRNFQQVLIDAP